MRASPLPRCRFLLAICATALALISPATPAVAEDAWELPLAGETKIVFAGVEDGKKILTAKDAFTQSLSRFDLQVRLKRTENATLEEWKKFVVAEVLPWSDEEIAHVKPAVTMLAEKLKNLGEMKQNEYLLRLKLDDYELTVFRDGRAVISGTDDAVIARSIYAKFVGI